MKRTLAVTIIVSVLLAAIPASPTDLPDEESIRDEVTSNEGVQFELAFFEDNLTLVIEGRNPTEDVAFADYVVMVDGRVHNDSTINLSSGDGFKDKINIRDSVDILTSSHNIYFSTYGADTHLNFTHEIDYRNTTRFPKPQITDVRVANGTVGGNQSTVAYVTVANPSNQLFSMKILVHTTGTQGGLYGASTPEYTNRTIKVELLEERGELVAGEVRLYVGEPSEGEGALDQVEFVGRADGETEVYNRTYEPVTGPWAEDAYRYRNESVEDRGSEGILGLEREQTIGVAAFLLALGVFVAWRRR
jgi:hypothetical protein